MDNNYSVKILESYMEVDKYNDSINNKLFNFITKSSELVNLSEDMYQVEKSIKLNKISLKEYILDSPFCSFLKENNILDYTIEELKNHLAKYEQLSNEDCSPYYLAISLYELLGEIENLVDNKIKLEIEKLSELEILINNIKSINYNEYEILYNQIKNNITNNYLNQNLIDDKSFNICIHFMNDIFNFYVSGYPDIPDKF